MRTIFVSRYISRPGLICKAKWDSGSVSFLIIMCVWWLIGGGDAYHRIHTRFQCFVSHTKGGQGVRGSILVSMHILTFVSLCLSQKQTNIILHYRYIHSIYTYCIHTYLRLCSTCWTQSTFWTCLDFLDTNYRLCSYRESINQRSLQLHHGMHIY